VVVVVGAIDEVPILVVDDDPNFCTAVHGLWSLG
jgi:hypothetical protein